MNHSQRLIPVHCSVNACDLNGLDQDRKSEAYVLMETNGLIYPLLSVSAGFDLQSFSTDCRQPLPRLDSVQDESLFYAKFRRRLHSENLSLSTYPHPRLRF